MVDKAFAERIANTHYNEVFSFCLSKLQNKTEAEDLTQDTFLAFQIKITVDGMRDDHVIAWLINTANNLIKNGMKLSVIRAIKKLLLLNSKTMTTQ